MFTGLETAQVSRASLAPLAWGRATLELDPALEIDEFLGTLA